MASSPFKKVPRFAVMTPSLPNNCDTVDAFYFTIREAAALHPDQVIILPWALNCVCKEGKCPAVKNKPERRIFRRLFRAGHGKSFNNSLARIRAGYVSALARLVENKSYRKQYLLYKNAIESVEILETFLLTVSADSQADINTLRSAVEQHKNGVF